MSVPTPPPPPDPPDPAEMTPPAPPSDGGGGPSFSERVNQAPVSGMVLALGLGLVAANVVTQTNMSDLWSFLWKTPQQASQVSANALNVDGLWTIGGEVVFVGALAFASDLSPVIEHAAIIFLIGVWAVWFTFNGQTLLRYHLFQPGQSGSLLKTPTEDVKPAPPK